MIGVGIIGTGGISHAHADGYMQLPDRAEIKYSLDSWVSIPSEYCKTRSNSVSPSISLVINASLTSDLYFKNNAGSLIPIWFLVNSS